MESFYLFYYCYSNVTGQTVELVIGIYHGVSLGLSASNKTLLEDIVEVRPTVLVAVPTLFQKIYTGRDTFFTITLHYVQAV